jgi:hypothetical protein
MFLLGTEEISSRTISWKEVVGTKRWPATESAAQNCRSLHSAVSKNIFGRAAEAGMLAGAAPTALAFVAIEVPALPGWADI